MHGFIEAIREDLNGAIGNIWEKYEAKYNICPEAVNSASQVSRDDLTDLVINDLVSVLMNEISCNLWEHMKRCQGDAKKFVSGLPCYDMLSVSDLLVCIDPELADEEVGFSMPQFRLYEKVGELVFAYRTANPEDFDPFSLEDTKIVNIEAETDTLIITFERV